MKTQIETIQKNEEKVPLEKPQLVELGQIESLTGEGGNDHDDGWHWSSGDHSLV